MADASKAMESGESRDGRGRFQPGHNLGGRPSGGRTRNGEQLRGLILDALDDLGGAAFMIQLGREHPKAFAVLLAKLLPKDAGEEDDKMTVLAQKIHELDLDHEDWKTRRSQEMADGAGI